MAEAAPVVTIDGPIGTGKGTISRLLAERLGFSILDSGAIYRALALSAQRLGLAPTEAFCELAARLEVSFAPGEPGEPVRVILDGEDVSDGLRSESCGAMASRLAVEPAIREALLERQRAFRRAPGLVADGRDMGTVVFPHADVKIYLTASPEERAQRRYKQLIAKGIDVNLSALLADIEERDKRDRERATAPLKPASDAVLIDTTGVDIEEVLRRVLEVVTGGLNAVNPG